MDERDDFTCAQKRLHLVPLRVANHVLMINMFVSAFMCGNNHRQIAQPFIVELSQLRGGADCLRRDGAASHAKSPPEAHPTASSSL